MHLLCCAREWVYRPREHFAGVEKMGSCADVLDAFVEPYWATSGSSRGFHAVEGLIAGFEGGLAEEDLEADWDCGDEVEEVGCDKEGYCAA